MLFMCWHTFFKVYFMSYRYFPPGRTQCLPGRWWLLLPWRFAPETQWGLSLIHCAWRRSSCAMTTSGCWTTDHCQTSTWPENVGGQYMIEIVRHIHLIRSNLHKIAHNKANIKARFPQKLSHGMQCCSIWYLDGLLLAYTQWQTSRC